MKRSLFILFAFLVISVQSFGQVTGSPFEIYVMNWRFGPRSLDYFKKNNIVVTNMLTHGSIEDPANKDKVHPARVRKALRSLFHNADSGGRLVLDWEGEAYKNLWDYPVTDSRYKAAEAEWRKLISIIREMRPNVKIGIYGTPFRAWGESTIAKFNPDRKYDELFSLVDFLAPSIYLLFTYEEVGHERNLQYVKDNMDIALDYGKRLHKPVYPFFWHRIHPYNKKNGNELIRIDVFAEYIKFLSNYSNNGYKANGVYWWEVLSKKNRLSKVDGLGGWAKGMVTDFDSYDALMVKYATAVVKELNQ